MRFRDLKKMTSPNDGTRTLFESVLPGEVLAALKDWAKHVSEPVLIGGIALSFYVKPRYTQDLDYLFSSEKDIPNEVPGFTRTRDHAFMHDKTHVEVEVLSPQFLSLFNGITSKVKETAKEVDGVKVASPEGLVGLKLKRGSMQDRADIVNLMNSVTLDFADWKRFLTDDELMLYAELREIALKEKQRNV